MSTIPHRSAWNLSANYPKTRFLGSVNKNDARQAIAGRGRKREVESQQVRGWQLDAQAQVAPGPAEKDEHLLPDLDDGLSPREILVRVGQAQGETAQRGPRPTSDSLAPRASSHVRASGLRRVSPE